MTGRILLPAAAAAAAAVALSPPANGPAQSPPERPVFVVAPNGSNSNPGSAALPWRTISHAARSASTGGARGHPRGHLQRARYRPGLGRPGNPDDLRRPPRRTGDDQRPWLEPAERRSGPHPRQGPLVPRVRRTRAARPGRSPQAVHAGRGVDHGSVQGRRAAPARHPRHSDARRRCPWHRRLRELRLIADHRVEDRGQQRPRPQARLQRGDRDQRQRRRVAGRPQQGRRRGQHRHRRDRLRTHRPTQRPGAQRRDRRQRGERRRHARQPGLPRGGRRQLPLRGRHLRRWRR